MSTSSEADQPSQISPTDTGNSSTTASQLHLHHVPIHGEEDRRYYLSYCEHRKQQIAPTQARRKTELLEEAEQRSPAPSSATHANSLNVAKDASKQDEAFSESGQPASGKRLPSQPINRPAASHETRPWAKIERIAKINLACDLVTEPSLWPVYQRFPTGAE